MFTLSHNGNILLDVKEHAPPSAAFIIESLEQSKFSDCKIAIDTIDDYFANPHDEHQLVVAKCVNATLNITISNDKMFAVGELTLAQGGDKLSLDRAKKYLVKAGVSRGYKQAYLELLLQKQFELPSGATTKEVLAKGRLPVDGESSKFFAQVKTLKNHLKTPKLRPDGTADMRDFGKLASVQPGELLIKQQPATPGKEGYTVTGDILNAKPGQSYKLVAGEGTAISKRNPLELIAQIAGVPVDIKNGMRVDDVFSISNVDVKSGHVDFEGSVIVTENIEPGMKVNAKGDITVFGTVESGELSALGDITVKQGVIGHQLDDKSLSCKVMCKGDLHLTHAQYCYLEGYNIFIKNQSSHNRLKALNVLRVGQEDNPLGKLFGGEVLDAQQVIAGEIGNESEAPMMINLATSNSIFTDESDNCTKEITKANEQLDLLQNAIEKADLVKDPEKKKLLLAKIGATQQHYCQQAELCEQRLSQLQQSQHSLLGTSQLEVNKVLHSGVEIHLSDKALKTNRDYPPCTIKLENSKLEINFKTS